MNNEIKEELEKIEHYKNYPQMIPFIGKYWGKYKKLLIIAESHYLAESTKAVMDDKYYFKNISSYISSDVDILKKWTSTNYIINNGIENNKFDNNSHKTYSLIKYSLENITKTLPIPPNDHIFHYIAFMNFFQRPAIKEEKSIYVKGIDVIIANEILKYIVNIIDPEYIFFVSDKAWKYFDERIICNSGIIYGHSNHPISWNFNKKYNGYTKPDTLDEITGKESFEYFVKENKIFG
jgi:hypothetical protein